MEKQNKTPILVLTGLAIVAAAAIAGLTRDRWMGETPPPATAVTAEAPAITEPPAAPEAPKTTEQTAVTEAPAAPEQTPAPEAPKAAEQTTVAEVPKTTEPAATAEQPEKTAEPEAAAPAQPSAAEKPAVTAEAPATLDAQQPASSAAANTGQPAAPAEPSQQAAAAPEQPAPELAPPAATLMVPAFDTVRVEKTGEAVVAGTAAPGADVVLKLDGKDIGKTTANDDGAFVIVLEKPLPAGSGALTLEAKGPDGAAVTTSAQSVAVIVPEAASQEALVAVVSPDQPTKVLQKPAAPAPEPAAAPAPETEAATTEAPKTPEAPAKPAKLVAIDAVDYDAAGNIVFSGQGEPGQTARVYIDNKFIGDAAVAPDGRWSFSGTADVAPGVHTLRVDGLDAKGEVVNRVEVPFFREAQSKVAEASPASPEAPAAAEAPKTDAGTAAPPPPRDGRVVIQPGNNLWRISRVLYGTGAKYTVLYEANKDQIRNPDLIYPGQVFKTPDVAAKFESVDPRRREPLKPDENAAPSQ